jgi:hypothetical protein
MATGPISQDSQKTWEWQTRLLPFVLVLLTLLTLFACVSNVLQVYQVEKHIETNHEIDLKELAPSALGDAATATEKLTYARWRTLVAMELNAIESRYHQANMILMTRVYIVFLGFTTGMVLAMVGATFILAKLRESESTMEAGTATWKMAFTSASPGLVLALFGTTLMLATIWARTEISVRDKSVYLSESFDVPDTTQTQDKTMELRKQLKQSSEEVKDTLKKTEK